MFNSQVAGAEASEVRHDDGKDQREAAAINAVLMVEHICWIGISQDLINTWSIRFDQNQYDSICLNSFMTGLPSLLA